MRIINRISQPKLSDLDLCPAKQLAQLGSTDLAPGSVRDCCGPCGLPNHFCSINCHESWENVQTLHWFSCWGNSLLFHLIGSLQFHCEHWRNQEIYLKFYVLSFCSLCKCGLNICCLITALNSPNALCLCPSDLLIDLKYDGNLLVWNSSTKDLVVVLAQVIFLSVGLYLKWRVAVILYFPFRCHDVALWILWRTFPWRRTNPSSGTV